MLKLVKSNFKKLCEGIYINKLFISLFLGYEKIVLIFL